VQGPEFNPQYEKKEGREGGRKERKEGGREEKKEGRKCKPHVHSTIAYNTQKVKGTQMFITNGMDKLWFIYTEFVIRQHEDCCYNMEEYHKHNVE
jgi:hypothetical protein